MIYETRFHNRIFYWIIWVLLILSFITEFGILQTEDLGKFCVAYNPKWGTFSQSAGLNLPMVKSVPELGCEPLRNADEVSGNIVLINRGNCSFFQKAIFAMNANASAIVIINNSSELFTPSANDTEYKLAPIPIVIIGESDAERIINNNNTKGTIYSPKFLSIDPNAVVLTLIAIILITLGSYWAVYEPALIDLSSASTDLQSQNFVFNVKTVIFYIITASVILVVLYFLYQYVVYIIIVIFVIGSASGIYMCMLSIMAHIPSARQIPEGKSCKIPLFGEISVKSVALTLLSFLLPVIWVIFRQSSNIWILQDILGSTLILGILRTVHLPNLKIGVILLVVFFLYDIFFVFITPLFTKDGKSIMVKVATGGDNHQEILPLTIVMPHFLDIYEGVCGGPGFSMLGFGDIIMPGFVISLCLAFDNFFGTKIYFYASLVGYVLGLFLTYMALLLMESAQPALLYLVPCVLVSIVIVGLKRGELKSLWTGQAAVSKTTLQEEEDKSIVQEQTNDPKDSENEPLIECDTNGSSINVTELEDVLKEKKQH